MEEIPFAASEGTANPLPDCLELTLGDQIYIAKERLPPGLRNRLLRQVPKNGDPHRDIIWITRAGALYPCYRTSTLIEHFQTKLTIPGVLFYPGEVVPPAGLSFMGIHEAEHNYRAKLL